MSGYITTFSGRRFSFEEPSPDAIDLRDIKHALSHICHWSGYCNPFFSVAQHSVLVALVAPTELKRWALLHDAAEAYCGDMTRPLKKLIPLYRVIELRVLEVIAEKFGIDWPEPEDLKQYDNQILAVEAKHFMPTLTALHDGYGNPLNIEDVSHTIPSDYLRPWTPQEANYRFGIEFKSLFL